MLLIACKILAVQAIGLVIATSIVNLSTKF